MLDNELVEGRNFKGGHYFRGKSREGSPRQGQLQRSRTNHSQSIGTKISQTTNLMDSGLFRSTWLDAAHLRKRWGREGLFGDVTLESHQSDVESIGCFAS
jgi:hypothetical protein